MPRKYLISSKGAVPTNNRANGGSFAGQEANVWMDIDVMQSANNIQVVRGNYTTSAAPSIPDANGSALTVKEAFSISSTIYPITYDGLATKTIPATPDLVVSDVFLASISAGRNTLRSYQTFAGTHTWPFCYPLNAGYNEFGTGLTDRSQAASWSSPTRVENGGVSPPLGLIGEVTRPCAVGLVGNSIDSQGDADAFSLDYIGGMQRGLYAAGIPCVNDGAASGAVAFLFSANAIQRAVKNNFLVSGYLTHAIISCQAADFANGRTAEQIIADVTAFKALLEPTGTKLIVCTCTPLTNSANNAINGSYPAQAWTRRDTWNAWVRAGGMGNGFFDIASVTEAGATSLWRTDLGTPTADGIHPATVIHNAIATYIAAQSKIVTGIWKQS